MGRKTFESIGRDHFQTEKILSFHPSQPGVKKVLTAMNLRSALALSRYPTFIVGGSQVYKDALDIPEIDTIYATEINAEFPGADTFFPEIDMDAWEEVSRAHHSADTENSYDFDFVTYKENSLIKLTVFGICI